MWFDVLKLRAWYHTLQGRLVQRVIKRQIAPLLPDGHEECATLGIGYPQPYLPALYKDKKSQHQIFIGTPPEIGATVWPEGRKNRTLILDAFPFAENTFDCIFLCHALEFATNADELMAQCWHALRPEGVLVVMVPNRRGAWARRDGSIFALGQPYSPRQLEKLLKRNSYKILQSRFGLFFPPFNWRPLLRFYETFEKIGERWRAPVGGVIVMQAQKDVFGMRVVYTKEKKKQGIIHVPAGVAECRKQKE